MKIVFMGTPAFSIPPLEALLAAGHDVTAVYSQPPRASGRGHRVQPSPVHALAERRRLPVRTPASLKSAEEAQAFAASGAELAVVVAYGLLLPEAILAAPRHGCFNIHASLLPRWRGAAPIARAIEAGDADTGVTIMRMERGLDTGPMLLARAVPIGPRTTAGDLADRLAALGATLIVEAIEQLARGALVPKPQPEQGATYARKIDKGETRLDWTRPAAELGRRVRAFHPVPGTWCEAAGERIKVIAAELVDRTGAPGTLLDDRLTIACGSGALRLERVQRAGRSPVSGAEFLRGFPIARGAALA